MSWMSRGPDKVGVLGTVISGMSCAMCFPALASIGAAVGLGFLQQWEPTFLHIFLPLFAALALLANAYGWSQHRQWRRGLLGVIGPAMVLIGRYAFTGGWFGATASRDILYVGVAVMIAVAIWDILSPANRRCAI